MLAGIVVQLVCMLGFAAYVANWTLRSIDLSRVRRAQPLVVRQLLAIAIASVAVIIRGVSRTRGRRLSAILYSRTHSTIILLQVYRTVELSGGFDGTLSTTELYILLDGIPIAVAMFILNLFHPCKLLKPTATDARRDGTAVQLDDASARWPTSNESSAIKLPGTGSHTGV